MNMSWYSDAAAKRERLLVIVNFISKVLLENSSRESESVSVTTSLNVPSNSNTRSRQLFRVDMDKLNPQRSERRGKNSKSGLHRIDDGEKSKLDKPKKRSKNDRKLIPEGQLKTTKDQKLSSPENTDTKDDMDASQIVEFPPLSGGIQNLNRSNIAENVAWSSSNARGIEDKSGLEKPTSGALEQTYEENEDEVDDSEDEDDFDEDDDDDIFDELNFNLEVAANNLNDDISPSTINATAFLSANNSSDRLNHLFNGGLFSNDSIVHNELSHSIMDNGDDLDDVVFQPAFITASKKDPVIDASSQILKYAEQKDLFYGIGLPAGQSSNNAGKIWAQFGIGDDPSRLLSFQVNENNWDSNFLGGSPQGILDTHSVNFLAGSNQQSQFSFANQWLPQESTEMNQTLNPAPVPPGLSLDRNPTASLGTTNAPPPGLANQSSKSSVTGNSFLNYLSDSQNNWKS
jgi:hypothetical protein